MPRTSLLGAAGLAAAAVAGGAVALGGAAAVGGIGGTTTIEVKLGQQPPSPG